MELQLQSTETNELFSALAKAQAEYELAVLDGYNPYFESKYATLTELCRVSRPALTKYGLSVIFKTHSEGEEHEYVITVLAHASGQYTSSKTKVMPYKEIRNKDTNTIDIVLKKDVQSVGSCKSYIMRYEYKQITGVMIQGDESDDDGEVMMSHKEEQEVKLPSQKQNFVPKNPSKPISPAQLDWLNKLLKKAPKGKEDELVKKYGALINIPMGDFNAVKDGLMAKPVQQVTVFEQEGKPVEAVSDFEEVDDLPF